MVEDDLNYDTNDYDKCPTTYTSGHEYRKVRNMDEIDENLG